MSAGELGDRLVVYVVWWTSRCLEAIDVDVCVFDEVEELKWCKLCLSTAKPVAGKGRRGLRIGICVGLGAVLEVIYIVL